MSDSLYATDPAESARLSALIARLSGNDATVSIFPDTLPYPTQIEGWVPTFAGETRGFYGDTWKPSWSVFLGPHDGHLHGGIDIYCPVGTPVVAVVDGDYQQVSGSDGNGMGNRAWLSFDINGVAYKFVYGHLDRFEGADSSVIKGAVLGYSGCSGNANTDPSCQGTNSCGKSSSHVHLQLMQGSTKVDPLTLLPWTLRYYDDARNVPCSQVTGSVSPNS